MTTAHRPTWTSAIGSGSNPSGGLFVAQTTKVANRDASSFLTLKTRKLGQGAPEERGSRREIREDLERREQKAREEQEPGGAGPQAKEGAKALEERKGDSKHRPAIEDNPFPEDADDDVPSGSERSDDDGDEDTEELMRELQKIKKEREEAEEQQRQQQKKQEERNRREEVMKGNPLTGGGDVSLKRKWDDDTVFKNQAAHDPQAEGAVHQRRGAERLPPEVPQQVRLGGRRVPLGLAAWTVTGLARAPRKPWDP
eukprot:CAMPEP_0179324786 /NCGR_PEP_ID=MMETSP0797-20121207/60499_1 /TAXON_ID=47934 /ORGANISM="Dinophysis acuminata, Strain DAEP01" /LENGTH=254 /DNA_ID=CAMNT_0021036837 /DNA_START=17 /DNA_END=777 /DNA_ORIENTATION=+